MKKILPLVKSTKSFKINIPRSVEAKIRHLCSVIHDVEWSGTLFYKVNGSIEGDDFEVTCVDICVMDIGSSAYTEYTESPDVITYRIDNGLLEEGIYEGLIHSHNNMSTFFSSTDQATLVEEGTNTNHFVSLIVNNEGKYTAGVTRRVTVESKLKTVIESVENKWYETYGGHRIDICRNQRNQASEEKDEVTKVIEWFELEVNKTEVDSFRELDERLAEIRKKKAKKTWTTTTPAKTTKTSSDLGYAGGKREEPKSKYGSLFDYDYGRGYWDDDYWDDYYSSGRFPAKSEPKKEEKKKEEKSPSLSSYEEVPLCLTEEFDKDLIESLALQLLTGSIIINKNSVNPTTWISKMDEVYEKRFHFKQDEERLREWISNMVDFLVYTEDEKLLSRLKLLYGETFTAADTSDICALGLLYYIDSIRPAECESEVLEYMMIELERYIPDGVQDYI